jgi:hypothetical protein
LGQSLAGSTKRQGRAIRQAKECLEDYRRRTEA